MADAPDLESGVLRRGGSSPLIRTMCIKQKHASVFALYTIKFASQMKLTGGNEMRFAHEIAAVAAMLMQILFHIFEENIS